LNKKGEGYNPIFWMIIIIFTIIVVTLSNILLFNMKNISLDMTKSEVNVIEFKLLNSFLMTDSNNLNYNNFNQNYMNTYFNIDERNDFSAKIILKIMKNNELLETKILYFNKDKYDRDIIRIDSSGSGSKKIISKKRQIPIENYKFGNFMGLVEMQFLVNNYE
jgi:hypothetical protein